MGKALFANPPKYSRRLGRRYQTVVPIANQLAISGKN